MQKSTSAVIANRQVNETVEALGSYRFAAMFQHGTLDVGVYAPVGEDTQHPHPRDEVYVIRSGQARFVTPNLDDAVGPGDMVFVPAHEEHRFMDMSEDFSCWVLFYGPDGGEASLTP